MKYIYGIVAIIILFSCLMWGINSKDSKQQPDKNALVVNERVIPFSELEKAWQQQTQHYRDQEEFIEDLVLREALIHEAIARGIADEDQFKRLVRDFFEQALVKTLLDRQRTEQKTALISKDIAGFRKARSSHYHLTLFQYPTLRQAINERDGKPHKFSDNFTALSESLQIRLLKLKPKELSSPFADGDQFIRIRIEAVEPSSLQHASTPSEKQLHNKLFYLQQQLQFEDWIQNIRGKAVVHYPEKRLSKGDDR